MSGKNENNEGTQTGFIRRLKARDEESWRVFYEQHRGMILARAIARGLSEAEAEEVVQETFLTLFKKIDEFIYGPNRRLAGFVAQTAGWRIEDKRDKRLPEQKPDSRQETVAGKTEFIQRVPDSTGSPQEALQKKESGQLARTLYEAVMNRIKARTSPKQYEVYELHTIKGRPVEEVCRALGVKPQDVYNAANRVHRRIQEEAEKLRQEVAQAGPQQGQTTILYRCLEKEVSNTQRATDSSSPR